MKVIQFGIGGVGSWCAEALIRGGVDNLTIVDFDIVSISNINRQLIATTKTIGMAKVDVMQQRLHDINPSSCITALKMKYEADTADNFNFNDYDYVIDAIDSLKDKKMLILRACESSATLISSMGAAGKSDPLQIRVAEFWKVKTCPLARALRNQFKHDNQFPAKKFMAVYSEEPSTQKLENTNPDSGTRLSLKPHIQVTATFGMNIAALILNYHKIS
ncbi:MAG: tRNA threonylcarbamoyladenosine dehydratase [Prevotellaceae bacterium]|nr:tRNA threonylcarbamoyladenosine dehydratase [Candidatus Colivivens equi]